MGQLLYPQFFGWWPAFIFCNHCRAQTTVERIFHNFSVCFFAQQNADRRIFVAPFHIVIQGFKIKLQLPYKCRLKLGCFQFYRHQTLKRSVKKQLIDLKRFVTYMQRIFMSNEKKIFPQFKDKVFHTCQNTILQTLFTVFLRQS